MDIPWNSSDGWDRDTTSGRQSDNVFYSSTEPAIRLDALLPSDTVTGVASTVAVRSYLDAMMDLTSRTSQPLALLYIASDSDGSAGSFGANGARLVGRAMARCLRQETRLHDVVGRADDRDDETIPQFFVVCPLMGEAKAALLAERLRRAMTTEPIDKNGPSLPISIGVAALSIDVADSAALIARAEGAVRNARRAGGARVWSHSDTLRRIAGMDQDLPE